MATFIDRQESGDWVDVNDPLDDQIELSAEGGEQDIILEYTWR